MALFFECMQQCARKVLDTADIVRDAMLQQYPIALPEMGEMGVHCSLLRYVDEEITEHGNVRPLIQNGNWSLSSF